MNPPGRFLSCCNGMWCEIGYEQAIKKTKRSILTIIKETATITITTATSAATTANAMVINESIVIDTTATAMATITTATSTATTANAMVIDKASAIATAASATAINAKAAATTAVYGDLFDYMNVPASEESTDVLALALAESTASTIVTPTADDSPDFQVCRV